MSGSLLVPLTFEENVRTCRKRLSGLFSLHSALLLLLSG